MGIEFDRSAGAWTGGAAGLATGVMIGRHAAGSTFVEDVVSTGGSLAGASKSKLPSVPPFFAGLAARRTAREFIANNPQLAELPKPVQNVMVDGIATRMGASLADPNEALDVLDSAASFAAKKLAPEHHEQITQALGAVRTQGVRTVNATVGASSARYLSRVAIPTVAGIAMAGVGALVGAALLPKLPSIGMPDISMPDFDKPSLGDRIRSSEPHEDDHVSNDALVGELIATGEDEYGYDRSLRVIRTIPDSFGTKTEATARAEVAIEKSEGQSAFVHRSFDDYGVWSVSMVNTTRYSMAEVSEVDRTGEVVETDSLLVEDDGDRVATNP